MPPKKPITLETRIQDLKCTFMGRILLKIALSVPHKQMRKAKRMKDGTDKDNQIKGAQAIEKMMLTSSIMTMSMASGGLLSYNLALAFKELANGHIIKGIKYLFKKRP